MYTVKVSVMGLEHTDEVFKDTKQATARIDHLAKVFKALGVQDYKMWIETPDSWKEETDETCTNHIV